MEETNFEKCLKKCIRMDKDILDSLSNLEDEVNDHRDTCNAVKTGGVAMEVAGAGICVCAVLAAPFTFGTSLAVAVGGGALSVAGGATNAITDAVDRKKTKEILGRIEELIDEKKECDEKLQIQIRNFTNAVNYILQNGITSHESTAIGLVLKGVVNGSIDLMNKVELKNIALLGGLLYLGQTISNEMFLLQVGTKISGNNLKFLTNFFGISTKAAGTSLKVLGRVAFVASVAFTVLDVAFLIRDWSTDHPTIEVIQNVRQQIREEISKLDNLLEILNSLKQDVYYTEVADSYMVMGSSRIIVEILCLLLEEEYSTANEKLHDLSNWITISTFKTLKGLLTYLFKIGALNAPDLSNIRALITDIVKTTGKKASEKIKKISKEIKEILDKKRKESNSKKRSMRGEHVINNGVINLYRDIINRFISRCSSINGNTLKEVSWLSHGTDIYKDYKKSLSREAQANIQDFMIAHIPSDVVYFDANAIPYGLSIEVLRESSVQHMLELYNNFDNYPSNAGTHHTRKIKTSVDIINNQSLFVDQAALSYWITQQGGSMITFTKTEDEVKYMFYQLYDKLRKWVFEIKRLERKR